MTTLRKRFPSTVMTTMIWSILCAGAANAQTADPATSQQELGTVEQDLQTSGQRQTELAAEIAKAIATENQLSDRLITMAKTIQSQEAALAKSESQLTKLAKEAIEIRSALGEKQDVLSELLAGLQRLEQNPPPALIVSPDDVLAALRGAMMFGAVVPDLRKEAELLAGKLTRLDQIQVSVASEKADLQVALAALAKSQIDVRAILADKKALLASQKSSLKQEKLKSAELAAKAKSLKQLLVDLAAERERAEQQKTLAAKQAEAEKARQQLVLARPQRPLSEARGKLDFPAQGQVLRHFGDDDGLGGKLQGLAIATREQAQVIAPIDGRVEFAGPFRSYGELLILDAGEGYLVLLAGMHAISAEIGQTIRAGEPVGEMGHGPSSVTLLGDSVQDTRPVLYIEFRKSGNPVDSGPWWVGGRKEASK